MPLQKHRDEKEVFAFDFAQRLAAGETLSNPAVKVTLRTGSPPAYSYTDKSAEFVQGAASINLAKAQFTLKAAVAANEQLEGAEYVVYVKVDTSAGRILVGTTSLSVVAEGA